MYIRPSHFVLGSSPLVLGENQRIIAAPIRFQHICNVFIFFAETVMRAAYFLQLLVHHAIWLEHVLEL